MYLAGLLGFSFFLFLYPIGAMILLATPYSFQEKIGMFKYFEISPWPFLTCSVILSVAIGFLYAYYKNHMANRAVENFIAQDNQHLTYNRVAISDNEESRNHADSLSSFGFFAQRENRDSDLEVGLIKREDNHKQDYKDLEMLRINAYKSYGSI